MNVLQVVDVVKVKLLFIIGYTERAKPSDHIPSHEILSWLSSNTFKYFLPYTLFELGSYII